MNPSSSSAFDTTAFDVSHSVLPLPLVGSTPRTDRGLKATLLGTGSYAPPRVIENSYFVDTLGLDTTSEWIEQRTGIVRRRYAEPEQKASDLAVAAAETALAAAGVAASDLKLIIVATSTPDFTMPTTACLVQAKLGASQAMAFDISNACAGFVYALDAATRYLQTGVGPALVVGVDLGSRLVSPTDRGTCIFFGDGAGAVVVGAEGPGRILASKMHSRGQSEALNVPVGGSMFMDGRAVWNFATDVLPTTIQALCDESGIPVDQLKLLVPHQANRNIIAASAEKVGLSMDRVMVNLDRYGNTLAASIPIALDEALHAGMAGPGDHVQLIGFGAGLAWGGLHWQL